MMIPLYDNIIVEKVKAREQTDNGIILPESRREQNVCKVVAVGDGYRQEDGTFIPLRVAVGDTVLVTPQGSSAYEDGPKTYYIMPEKNVLMKITDFK